MSRLALALHLFSAALLVVAASGCLGDFQVGATAYSSNADPDLLVTFDYVRVEPIASMADCGG